MKNKKIKKFGENLKEQRRKKGKSLREICSAVGYDASNWSKIERGILSPPSDVNVLKAWGKELGIKGSELESFIDNAMIAQGIIPEDLLSSDKAYEYLPAFFRTMRNKKPTKEELDRLIELIRNA